MPEAMAKEQFDRCSANLDREIHHEGPGRIS